MKKWLLVGLVLSLALAGTAYSDNPVLTGTVYDADGKPVKDATVATLWFENGGADGVKTDKDGRFRLQPQHYFQGPISLFVRDAERKRGAIAIVEDDAFDRAVQLKLEKLVRVHGTFTCSELGAPPSWSNAYAYMMPGRKRLCRCMGDEPSFEFLLPPGMYQIKMYGSDVQDVVRSLDIEGDNAEIDWGAIDLKATPVAKLYGKALPPWTVTDARGVSKDVQLTDYKGKWVLIEFWFST